MKGIVTVNKSDLKGQQELQEALGQFCETIKEDSDFVRFYSRDGALMNILCALLDKEIHYKLSFENNSVRIL